MVVYSWRMRSITSVMILNVFLGLGCAFVVLSANSVETHFFRTGVSWIYQLNSTVLLNEKDGGHAKDVGFSVTANVAIESIWEGNHHEKLLKVEVEKPQLYIRSRKRPTPEGFTAHTSKLEKLQNDPFYVLWKSGRVEKLLINKDEPLSIKNMKKGIASLLQFQLLDQTLEETDASGKCQVTYTSNGPNTIIKTKSDCKSDDLKLLRNPKPLLDIGLKSAFNTKYEIEKDNIKSIISDESHSMMLAAKEEAGNTVTIRQELKFLEEKTTNVLQGSSFEAVSAKLPKISTETLLTEVEHITFGDEKSFEKAVKENKDNLKNNLLGTVPSAKSFIQLVHIARKSNKEEILSVLQSPKNKNILNQLIDILGFVQSISSHDAAMTILKFENFKQIDINERYLWALSICAKSNPVIITDLLDRYRASKKIPENLRETIVLTIASMTYNLRQIDEQNEVLGEIEKFLLEYLETTEKPEYRYSYLRALKNLRSPTTIPTLLKFASKGTLKEGVLAWKALYSLQPHQITPEVLKVAYKTFYQIDKLHDSSSRTIALDILLESSPSDESLRDILYFLHGNSKAFEVKQYIVQKMLMYSEMDPKFYEQLNRVLRNNPKLNNYGTYSQKGISVALKRQFLGSQSSNGSLLTVQEMNGGMVKRGIVNVILDKDGVNQEIFSLGVFSGGLSSFFSSADSDGDASADDVAMAGMELAVLGTQIRPFTFFTGQSELMGHVWSGTASDRTTAFQAISMLQDHLQYLRLGNGFIADLDLKGAASFDLSGQVTFSLWNRNAESIVEKSAGIAIIGVMRVDSSFIRSQVEFSMLIEPKLSLQANVDFYSTIVLCMRLQQPEATFKHNIYKIERIPGSKHRLRISQTKKHKVPGKTYMLNKKNSEMCNVIFS